jgi:hypothetical protein
MKPEFLTAAVRTGLLLSLVVGSARVSAAQSTPGERSDVAALRAEVQRLERELLAYRAEVLEWKMHSITAELREVQSERQRLAGDRQTIEREIGELNLASTHGPGSEDEGRKEELSRVHLPAVLAGERAVSSREATLAAALSVEDARMAEIRRRLQRMPPQAAQQQH